MIQIRQDNRSHEVVVHKITQSALHWLGYQDRTLDNEPVAMLFQPNLTEDIADEVIYQPAGPDVGDVLRKYRQLPFRHARGHAIESFATISFGGMDGMNPLYTIRIEDADRVTISRRGGSKLAVRMAHKAPNTYDPETRLPDGESFARDMRLTLQLMDELHGKAYLLMVSAPTLAALQAVAALAKQSFRGTDVITRAGRTSLGIILMDADEVGATVPLRRFLEMVAAKSLDQLWMAGCSLSLHDDATRWLEVAEKLGAMRPTHGDVTDLRPYYRALAGG